MQGCSAAPPSSASERPWKACRRPPRWLTTPPTAAAPLLQSYDRSTIEAWLARCAEAGRPATDPLTRAVLRAATLVPNYSLKSLVASWAERNRIADLPAFSKAVGRERSLSASPGRGSAAMAAAAEIACMLAEGDGGAAAPPQQQAAGAGSGADAAARSRTGYPELAGGSRGGSAAAAPAESSEQRPPAAAAAQLPAALGLYPSAQQPAAPVSKRAACEAALSALRAAAAARGGGAAGAAAYHAWGLAQLAADSEGRDLLWEVGQGRGGGGLSCFVAAMCA